MTLIISQASFLFGLQVSDRLVSRGGAPFDPIANKNLLYRARDGIVSIGYSGTAFIDSIPTDQWIAEKLTGYSYERDRRPPMLRLGKLPQLLSVGSALRCLVENLNAAFRNPRINPNSKRMAFEVAVIGWQWKKGNTFRPIIAKIEKPHAAPDFKLWHGERHFGRQFQAVIVPQGNASLFNTERLRSGLRSIQCLDDAETAMILAIREASANQSSLIGANCMSIAIRSPLNPEARVRYVGAPVAAQIVSELNPERENVLPAAFTPWLIAPSAVRAPSIFTGSLTQELAGYQVLVEGPRLTGPRLHVFEAGLDRPAESGGSLKNRSPEPCLGVTLLSKQIID